MPSSPSLLPAPARQRLGASRCALITIITFALLGLWDLAGQDLALARWWGSAQGFELRDNYFLVVYVHEAMRMLGWALVLALSVGVWFPFGVLRALSTRDRAQLLVGILVSLAVVAIFKRISTTSCPWDLSLFGGVADYVSHWRWGVHDGGVGHCFPAGHAAAGFAFLGGYFPLRRKAPGAAHGWLAGALTLGMLLGIGQQMRGAHYMSHTLWTAWLCWTTGWLIDVLLKSKCMLFIDKR